MKKSQLRHIIREILEDDSDEFQRSGMAADLWKIKHREWKNEEDQMNNIKSMLQRKVDDYFLAFEEGFEPKAYENATIKDILADFMEYAMASND